MKSVLFRAFMILAIFHILSLALFSCDCKNRILYCHTIDTISIIPLNNAGKEPLPLTYGQVIAKAFILQLNVDDNFDICRNNYSFINAAYAFKKDNCEDHQYNDKPVDISITSNKDFDASHKAGSELRALFKGPDVESIQGGNKYDFLMLYEPADTGTHIFNLKLTMQNQKVLEVSSQSVKLLK